jgi:hypothetical protein
MTSPSSAARGSALRDPPSARSHAHATPDSAGEVGVEFGITRHRRDSTRETAAGSEEDEEDEDEEDEADHHEMSAVAAAAAAAERRDAPLRLEFERRANAELRREVERLRALLRNSRGAATAGTASVRALREDNERLRGAVARLEEQAGRERAERVAQRRRFDERVAQLAAEHRRVALAQEEEIQELRLQLEVAHRVQCARRPAQRATGVSDVTNRPDSSTSTASPCDHAKATSQLQHQQQHLTS